MGRVNFLIRGTNRGGFLKIRSYLDFFTSQRGKSKGGCINLNPTSTFTMMREGNYIGLN
jgi:hypothetical protein